MGAVFIGGKTGIPAHVSVKVPQAWASVLW